jgi:large subunit ribosomal protein L6
VSRIGRLPVQVPSGVTVDLSGSTVTVKGPKGELRRTFSNLMAISHESGQLVVTRGSDQPVERALHGTTRAHGEPCPICGLLTPYQVRAA